MPANIIRVVERIFDQSSADLFRAWTEPGQMAQWAGSPGWHVERETVTLELRLEFVKTGRDGTLAPVIQGPYDQAVAHTHSQGWERELTRLQA